MSQFLHCSTSNLSSADKIVVVISKPGSHRNMAQEHHSPIKIILRFWNFYLFCSKSQMLCPKMEQMWLDELRWNVVTWLGSLKWHCRAQGIFTSSKENYHRWTPKLTAIQTKILTSSNRFNAIGPCMAHIHCWGDSRVLYKNTCYIDTSLTSDNCSRHLSVEHTKPY